MIARVKVYKCMGYLFPVAMASVLATGMPGAIALILYWCASLHAKNAYVKELSDELKLLEKMHDEVKSLIQLCNKKVLEYRHDVRKS
jgi:undecaprenyl pyrophosphate synthase